MDKFTQYLVATVLVLLGMYALVYSGSISLPFAVPILVLVFWSELALIGMLYYSIRSAPLIVVPTAIAVLSVLAPTASSVLRWTASYLEGPFR